MIIQNPLLTGSLNYNGADLSNVTSSNANSASVSLILTAVSSSNQQLSASYIALSGSYNVFSGSASTRITTISSSQQDISSSLLQVSASYIALSGSYNTFSGSASTRVTKIENNYATTGSNSFRADQSITGSLVVSSTITAQTLVVQTVTSSIVYSSGSNIFGSALSNTQTFTGSIYQTGSIAAFAGSVGIGTINPTYDLTLSKSVAAGNVILNLENTSTTGAARFYFGNNASSTGARIQYFGATHAVRPNLFSIGTDAANDMMFETGGTERMRISAAGTASFTGNSLTSAADAATINLKQNSTTANTGIYLERSGEQKGYYIYVGGSVDSLTFQRNNAGTKADVMSLTRDGNVGIGTSSPLGKLDISTGGNRNVVISNDSTDTGYNIVSLNGSRTKGAYAGIAGGGTGDNSLYLNSGVDIVFQNGASFTQRMRTVNEFTLAGGPGGTGGPTQVIGTTSMCGILFVSIGTQNCAAIFIINAATPPVLVSQTSVETRFSITYNSGNTANVYVSGTNIELQNNIQATRAFYCQFFGKLS